MSDQFKVPEPSEAARRAYLTALNVEPGTFSSVLAAAYAQDVPPLVRAEVERALRKRQENPLGFGIAAYLAARFGAAPEVSHLASLREVPANGTTDTPTPSEPCDHQWATETTTFGKTYCVRCGKVQKDPSRPTPSAPAAPSVTAVLNERPEPLDDLGARRAATTAYLRDTENREEKGVKMLPTERDFLRALAQRYLDILPILDKLLVLSGESVPVEPGLLERTARRVVEEGR